MNIEPDFLKGILILIYWSGITTGILAYKLIVWFLNEK